MELNHRPAVYETAALPTELRQPKPDITLFMASPADAYATYLRRDASLKNFPSISSRNFSPRSILRKCPKEIFAMFMRGAINQGLMKIFYCACFFSFRHLCCICADCLIIADFMESVNEELMFY